MGRLQKKKPVEKKKKQREEKAAAGEQSVHGGDSAIAEKAAKELKMPSLVTKISTAASAKQGVAKGKASGFPQRAVQFLREVKIELKKVAWPTRKQTLGSTVVVIILVMIISFFLGVVDIGLSSLVSAVLQ